MERKSSTNAILVIAAAIIAAAIFVVDTLTRPAVAVLYVAVVLLAIRFCERRGVLLVALGCVALTILSYILSPDRAQENVFINGVISILAIGVTTYLALENQSAVGALHKGQMELAHVTRVTTLGQLTASIAHEVNQPLAGIISNAQACQRWLSKEPPDLDEARNSVEWIINDGNRASEVIQRVRALANRADTQKAPLDINDVINEGVTLLQRELTSHRVSLRLELMPHLPTVMADRVQLQQVIINLVMNGIEAMQLVTDRARELVIRSYKDQTNHVLVTVMDCGVGISDKNTDQMFDAFFTTKSSGMGMGLSICRSIIGTHGGRMLATNNAGPGATFQFLLPANREMAE
jgi:C4-dicarboxylate-specific signal transduction histidine kinase